MIARLLPFVVGLVLAAACSGPQPRYIRIDGYAQGGRYAVKLNLQGVSERPEAIRDSIDALLLQIDTTLSGYNRKSLLSRFNRGEKVPATPMFCRMYAMARDFWKRSEGAVDCAAGPLYDAWGFGFREGRFPAGKQVDSLLGCCGMRFLPDTLPVSGGYVNPADLAYPQLNYNAIAQGYSCDVIAAYLRRIGVRDMLVDIGEIWCEGIGPTGKPWSVGIDRPEDDPTGEGSRTLEGIWESDGKSAGIVTSGNYRKFYLREGRKYAHTIDPRTGFPVQHNLLSATVISPESAASADALATWCMVIGLDNARELILSRPELAAFLVYADTSGAMCSWASPGLHLRDNPQNP